MRRLARRLFNFLTILSLLLCVAVCVLWVRSLRVQEQLTWRCGASLYTAHLFWSRGDVALTTTADTDFRLGPGEVRFTANPKPIDLYSYWRTTSAMSGRPTARFGFATYTSAKGWGLLVPAWSVLVASAVLPALGARAAVRRWRRPRQGLCVRCGYDLRATPDRCPECGAVPPAGNRVAA